MISNLYLTKRHERWISPFFFSEPLLEFFFCFFSFLQRNTKNRPHTNVKYNKLSTDAENVSRTRRTTTLAIPADDGSALLPINETMHPYTDHDDDDDDEPSSVDANESHSRTDQISFYT